MMKKNWKLLLLVCLLAALVLSASLPVAAGFNGDPATELAVYVNGECVKTYTLENLEALTREESSNVNYCSIDSMPATVYTVATGVYLEDLLADIGVETSAVSTVKMTAVDNYSKSFAAADLFANGYYYPALFTTDLDGATGTMVDVAAAQEGAVAVKPMIAYNSYQTRITDGNDPTGNADLVASMDGSHNFRFCFGLKAADLTSGTSTTSSFGEGICRLDVTVAQPEPDVVLSVYVNDKLVVAYTAAGLADLVTTASTNVSYSAVDKKPAAVYAVATGVTIEKLVANMDLSMSRIESLKVSAADGYSKTFSGDVLRQTGYYFPGIYEDGALVDGKSTATEGAVAVPPMISISAYQTRVEDGVTPTGQYDGMKTAAQTFYCGYTAADLAAGTASSNKYVGGITRLDITATTQYPLGSDVFTDLGGFVWADEAVGYLYANGTVSGTSATTYGSASPIKRGDFILMLARAFDFNDANTTVAFGDVPAGKYYASAIANAKELGIALGYNGQFQPESSLTRQDAVVLICRTLEKFDQELTVIGDLSEFGDANAVSGYAQNAMAKAVGAGLIIGSGGQLNPKDSLTRAEMAVILYRALA